MTEPYPTALYPLAAIPRWLTWGYRTRKRLDGSVVILKMPCMPDGAATPFDNPFNLRTLGDALAVVEKGRGADGRTIDGVGFAPDGREMPGHGRLVCVDIDDCRDAESGELTAEAAAIVGACGSYTEISPSGRGIRILGWCGDWEGLGRKGKAPYEWAPVEAGVRGAAHGLRGEIYLSTGYVTVTMNVLCGGDTPLQDIGAVVEAILAESIKRRPDRDDRNDWEGSGEGDGSADGDGNDSPLVDIEIIRETLAAIDNSGERPADWDWWKSDIGMAVFRASGGSADGLDTWIEWSRGNPAYVEGDCEIAWDEIHASPPRSVGFGKLFYEAQQSQRKRGVDWRGGPLFIEHRFAAQGLAALPMVEGQSSRDAGPLGGLGGSDGLGGIGALGGVGGSGSGDGVSVGTRTWRDMLARGAPKKDGAPGPIKGNMLNVGIALRNAPEWRDVLRYDTFSNRVMVVGRPPWEGLNDRDMENPDFTDNTENTYWTPRELKEDDVTRAAIWMQAVGIEVYINAVNHVIVSVAKEQSFSSVVDYLDGLVWDGKARLDTLLVDFLGAEDTELNRAFTSKTLIAAVARAYRPGCQVKTVLTLEGRQDLGKSKFCATLVPVADWFTDTCPDFGSKDAALQLQGIWIQEHSEMATLGKADAARAKAFISTHVDRYRMPYGTVAESFPRQCIFVATVNPGAVGYLKDDTGASRFWPVECGVTWGQWDTLDAERLKGVRDQVWAEAVARYRAGEVWWLNDTVLREAHTEAAEDRFDADTWEEVVSDYLKNAKPPVTVGEVLTKAIGKDKAHWTKLDAMKIGTILHRLGWERRRVRHEGGREYRYVPIGWSGEVIDFVAKPKEDEPLKSGWASPIGSEAD